MMLGMLAKEYFGYLEQLEQVSSRLAMLEILAAMYGQMSGEEALQGTYMLFGKLGPSYTRIEFGMADKMVARAIVKAYNADAEDVLARFKEKGDWGLVAASFAPANTWEDNLTEVYDKLAQIANLGGGGSQEAKVDLLARVFSKADAVSAKYLARIPIGKIRIGVGEMTVLDGLSWLVTQDKSLHTVMENAYNTAADVGLLAREVVGLKQENSEQWRDAVVESLEKMKARVGVPMVMALCTRMETFDEVTGKLGAILCEPKYDGTRVQVHFWRENGQAKFVTFSRNLEESSYMFPELEILGDLVDADEAIFDCEAMGIDKQSGDWAKFQVTMTRKRKHGISEKAIDVPLRFMVFDVLYAKGKGAGVLGADGDIHRWPLEKRRALLEKVVTQNDLVSWTPTTITEDPEVLRRLHNQYLDEGLEGVILKKLSSEYVPGRKKGVWVKMKEVESAQAKLPDTVDCVVMGYYRGEGRRSQFGIGSLLLGVRGFFPIDPENMNGGLFDNDNSEEKFWTVSKLGSKLNDEQLKEIKKTLDELATGEKDRLYEVPKLLEPDVWVRPEMVVEVAADNLTRSPMHSARLALRFPRLVRVREDKSPGQTTSVEELVEMYKMQKG